MPPTRIPEAVRCVLTEAYNAGDIAEPLVSDEAIAIIRELHAHWLRSLGEIDP